MKTKLARALHDALRIKSVRTVLAAALGVALGTSLAINAAAATAASAQPLGIAFVYLGNPGDAGWTYAHEQGVKEVEAKFGDKIKVTRVENVPESADSERVFRDLASKGNKIVVGSSFGFQDFELKVAKDFPDAVFEHATGYKKAANFATYDVRTYQSAYLAVWSPAIRRSPTRSALSARCRCRRWCATSTRSRWALARSIRRRA